jgi:hypothetical protein
MMRVWPETEVPDVPHGVPREVAIVECFRNTLARA